MLTYQLDEQKKYASLYEHIRDDILHGVLKEGDKLPSKRTLAQNLSVSVITVQQAYDQLLAEGYIRSVERSGYYVNQVDVVPQTEQQEFSLPTQRGKNQDSFPFSVWARLTREVLLDYGEALLQRTACDGDPDLKGAIAHYLYRARGMVVQPRYVVVGAGAEYLYGILVQLLGRDKKYAVESPGYPSISRTYTLNGAMCVPIPVHADGVHGDEVAQSGATVLHLSPSHQFPTGAIVPVEERLRLIAWAREVDGYVIEDEYDSEFRLFGKPLPTMYALGRDHVVYINTFSKTLAPSMRMGYMVLPPALYERYLTLFGDSASVVPLFEQKTLARMIESGAFERHLNRKRTRYRAVKELVMQKLSALPLEHAVWDTGSGLHFLVTFANATEEQGAESLTALGLNATPLSHYDAYGMWHGKGACFVLFLTGIKEENE